jgi:hypothetical protein
MQKMPWIPRGRRSERATQTCGGWSHAVVSAFTSWVSGNFHLRQWAPPIDDFKSTALGNVALKAKGSAATPFAKCGLFVRTSA